MKEYRDKLRRAGIALIASGIALFISVTAWTIRAGDEAEQAQAPAASYYCPQCGAIINIVRIEQGEGRE